MSKSERHHERSATSTCGRAAVGDAPHRHGSQLQPVSWIDCAGGGQVVVERNIAYVGNMRNPHGTPDHRRSGSQTSQTAGRNRDADRHAFAQGARARRHHGHQPRESSARKRARRNAARGLSRRSGHLRHRQSGQAEADHPLGHDRQARARLCARRAPLRFRRPLRLHLADDGRLRRQHRDDPRSQGPGAAAGSRALVDAGAVDCRRRESRPGKATRTSATTRCASATGSTPATGRAGS